jgi:hypothetical protein
MLNKKILFLIILLTGFYSCTKKQGPVEPEINLVTVSFATDIQPIFDAQCISCHNLNLESNFGNLNLESDKSYLELVNIEADFDNSYKRVLPEDGENSYLWMKINGSFESSNMPLGGTPLSETEQDLIKKWIDEGALDN